ncbi:RHS repeat protein, partial [Nocardia farcinica]|uniref:RHS repeat domain-containing protein n=1 Tax=Nocardia farcinica TaxID=37329 RepID=UPI0018952732
NEVGLRTYQSNAIAEVWYGFDVMDRLSVVTQSVGSVQSVVAYSHDLNGNRTAVTYPGNKTVTYGFDAANRLTNVNAAAIASGLSMGIQRDDL